MNRQQLIRRAATRADVSVAVAKRVVDAIFGFQSRGHGESDIGLIGQQLLRRRKVAITGFGVFDTVYSAPRPGRNPQTGEAVSIPGSLRPRCRISRSIKGAVRAKFLGRDDLAPVHDPADVEDADDLDTDDIDDTESDDTDPDSDDTD